MFELKLWGVGGGGGGSLCLHLSLTVQDYTLKGTPSKEAS